ncbi:Glycosyltransferase AglJ [Candidatus Burarchaeum australiense]|nr:Glycosyltransferase AglJ [Candidatus Burarchaeum australiense]
MGKPALYAVTLFGISVAIVLVSAIIFFLMPNTEYSRGAQVWQDAASWLAVFAVAIIFLDFAFLSHWGRAKRTVRYDPIENPKVTVCMPAYNEASVIGRAVSEFRKAGIPNLSEVVVRVAYPTTDDTAAIAKKAGARIVMGKADEHGYGYACMHALAEAAKGPGGEEGGVKGGAAGRAKGKPDVVILCEGDGTFSAVDAKKLLAYIENADMVVGTRTVVEVLDPDSQVDWFINWGNKFIARMLQMRYWGRVRLSDVGCTYRAIRRDALERLMPKLHDGGNTFSLHMLLVALDNGLTLLEVPVTFRQRVGESKGVGNAKVKGFLVGLRMLWSIFMH